MRAIGPTTIAVCALAVVSPATAEPPFINSVFPPPGYVGPAPDPGSPHDLPVYPLHATQCQESGTARVALTIGEDGRVAKVDIVQSTGFADLDAATVIALRKWRYSPATKDGHPLAVRIAVELPLTAEKHGPDFAADCTAEGTEAAARALWSAGR